MKAIFCGAIVYLLSAGWLAGCADHSQQLLAHSGVPIATHPRKYFHAGTELDFDDSAKSPIIKFPRGSRSVKSVLSTFSPYALVRLKPYFVKAAVSYPPKEVALLAFKDERRLELWARENGRFFFIRSYRILAASGTTGPKLRRGDEQVPEGIYSITQLNPNSQYHLSLKIGYPNKYDLAHAERDGRKNLGGDIYIHGKNVSVGCLAVGDSIIEELFMLVGMIGAQNVRVIISPSDPRKGNLYPRGPSSPSWVPELYKQITRGILSVTGGRDLS